MTHHRKRRRPTWFDVPPIELVSRIALFLSAREHTPSTLAFAQLSNNTSRAVAAALEYRLIIDTTTHLQAAAWRLVFADSLRQLTISTALPFNHEYVPLLRAPRIHTLSIPPHPEYFEAIAASKTLRSLSVSFRESVLSSPGLPHFVKVLPTLRITTLRLLNEGKFVPSLYQNLFTAFHSDPPLLDLGWSCPHVESLHIGVQLWSTRQLLPILQRFKKLRNLSLCGVINICEQTDEHLIRFMRGLDSVQLNGMTDAPSLAIQLGSCVTYLRHGPTALCELEALGVCTKLEVLDVEIGHGDEKMIGELGRGLRCLRLRWRYGMERKAYSPESGVLVDLAKNGAKLREFHVMDAEIALAEGSRMMEVMGRRLVSFGFPLTCQGQTAMETLVCLATAGARWNSELEELCPSGRGELFSSQHWGWRPQRASLQDQERLMRALKRLHEHAPLMRVGELERLGSILTSDCEEWHILEE